MLALLSIPLLVTTAAAGPLGSGGGGSGGNKGGGGGALSKVSGGVRAAASSSSPSPSGGRPYPTRNTSDYHGGGYRCYDLLYREVVCRPQRAVLASASVFGLHRTVSDRQSSAGRGARLHFFAGAQKVADSDGAGTIELAATEDRFRLAVSFTRFFERLDGGGVIQMSMPTLMGGIRIDDMGATSVIFEGGVVHARTSGDPMGNSKITGPAAGLRVEHSLSKDISILGDVQQMWFPHEIRATGGRAAVRWGNVQAGFRVLDFNVGPPLYGPEVGVRF